MGEEIFDGNNVAEIIFRCIVNIKRHFGINYISSILVGSKSQKIAKYKHEELEQYGKLKQYSFEQVRLFISDLIEQEYLFKTRDQYPIVFLIEKGKRVLAGSEDVEMKKPDPELAKRLLQKGESVTKTLDLYKSGKSVLDISKERGLSTATVLDHLATGYQMGEEINIDQFVPKQKLEMIFQAFQKFGTDFLTPVKQNLEITCSWEDLKLARAKFLRQNFSI